MGPVASAIRDKLTAALSPTLLQIDDESARHAGHAGSREGGESHFHVTVESQAFAGQSAVSRQRRVYQVLAEELKGPVHALSLTLRAPGEASKS
ncbi:MAG TPA: BolA family protein [Caulobacteraceae bacterium]|jgi:BolA protein